MHLRTVIAGVNGATCSDVVLETAALVSRRLAAGMLTRPQPYMPKARLRPRPEQSWLRLINLFFKSTQNVIPIKEHHPI